MMTRKVITLENFQADFDCKIPSTFMFLALTLFGTTKKLSDTNLILIFMLDL